MNARPASNRYWSSRNNFLWQSRMTKTQTRLIKHPFHIVNPRPWPMLRATGAFYMARGISSSINQFETYVILWKIGFFLVLISIYQWWRDVRREATFQGKHTIRVEGGIRLGMVLFIVREVFFFLSFFWAFYHSSLRPSRDVGSRWPPAGVVPIPPFGVPLLNTALLLSSGASITWAHRAIIISNPTEANISLLVTMGLGAAFTVIQIIEIYCCGFTMSDSVFGRTFYIATGFHGVHVVVGTLFITVAWWRHENAHMTRSHHFGFEASAWYWHFVDVVWLFLYISLYWWRY